MPIRFFCEACTSRIKVPDGTEGKLVKCPGCGHAQRVPRVPAEPVEPPRKKKVAKQVRARKSATPAEPPARPAAKSTVEEVAPPVEPTLPPAEPVAAHSPEPDQDGALDSLASELARAEEAVEHTPVEDERIEPVDEITDVGEEGGEHEDEEEAYEEEDAYDGEQLSDDDLEDSGDDEPEPHEQYANLAAELAASNPPRPMAESKTIAATELKGQGDSAKAAETGEPSGDDDGEQELAFDPPVEPTESGSPADDEAVVEAWPADDVAADEPIPVATPVARVRQRVVSPRRARTPVMTTNGTALLIAGWFLRVIAVLSVAGVVKVLLWMHDSGSSAIDLVFITPLMLGMVGLFWAVGELALAARGRSQE